MFLSAVTIFEIEIGALKVAWRDKTQGGMLRVWIDGQVLPRFADHIIPVDAEIALRAAKLHVPNPRPDRDAYIAATALVHNLTVVTRNVSDFQGTGVTLLNPWQPPA